MSDVVGVEERSVLNQSRLSLSPPLPNPTSGPVAFHLTGTPAEGAKIEIFDAAGQLVRQLAWRPTTDDLVVWDGLLENGRIAPTGVYYFRARTDESEATGRAIVIR